MAEHPRPDPDELLARIQAEEQQKARGRLKIFLGYAAGVGKTYAMLEAARQRKEEGVDLGGPTSKPMAGSRPRRCCKTWRSFRASK